MEGNIFLLVCLICLHLPIGLCRGDATPDVNCGQWHAIYNGYDGQKQVAFCQEQLSRDVGFKVCEDKKASLLSISDYTYKVKLWEFFKETSQLSVPYWVGLYFDKWAGGWMWPDRQNHNQEYVRWRDGEPNNSSGSEACADLRRVGDDFELTDNNCDKPQFFMCERTIAEDSTSVAPTTTTAATTTPISSTTPITSTTPLPTPTTKARSASYCFTDVTVQPTRVTGDGQSRPAKCPPLTAGGLQWPETAAGVTARVRCTNGEGEAEWQCGQNPVCWLGQPNLVPCASRQFRDLLEKTVKPLTTAEAVGVAGNLERVTAGSGVSSADIAVATQVISGLGALQSQTQDRTQVPAIVTSVARVGSNLVSDQSLDTWNGMASEERLQSATDLLVALETTAASLSSRLDSPTVLRQADNNLDMQVQVVNPALLPEGLHYASTNSSGSFRIPTTNLRHSPDGLSRAVFMTHFRMATILGGGGGGRSPNLTSSVLSASLPSDTPTVLQEPVTFTLRHAKDLKKDAPVMCVFWRITEGERGYWSQEGCAVVSSNSSHTTCQCNHLTNFAILLDIHGVELTKTHSEALWYITLVGCIISLIALFISFLTFTFVSSLQGERNSIHQHLAVCLFVTELVFLAGISRTSDRVGCGVVAGLLHYFLLATFTWMFLEGLHIVFMLVQVFDAAKSRVKYYCLAGYGIPFIIVLISIASFHEGYGTDKHCWLTTENMFILSFALPAAIILSVNAIILTFAIVKVCQHSEFVFTAKDKGSPNYRGWLQGAAGMEVLLGITWILGYFFINHQTLAFAYLFTILNSLQGLFIFIFHCLLNKKVRKEYARNLGCGPETGSTATSRFWSRKPSTSDTMPGSSQSQTA